MHQTQTDVVDLRQVLVESYAVSERMNQIVLEHLDPAAWRAQLPGSRGTDDRRHRRARPQHPAEMAKAIRSASQAPLTS